MALMGVFKALWGEIKQEIWTFFVDFHSKCIILKGYNASLVALIPKKEEAVRAGMQSAFIKGESITLSRDKDWTLVGDDIELSNDFMLIRGQEWSCRRSHEEWSAKTRKCKISTERERARAMFSREGAHPHPSAALPCQYKVAESRFYFNLKIWRVQLHDKYYEAEEVNLKFLLAPPDHLEQNISAIREGRDLSIMTLEVLYGILKTYELEMLQRKSLKAHHGHVVEGSSALIVNDREETEDEQDDQVPVVQAME
ncbi:hypothetical protein AgCh_028715 [Apium graveolens]